MKAICIAVLAASLSVFGISSGKAQTYTELTFGAGFPTGEFHEFVPQTGWWNVQFQARKSITDRYEIGGAVGWSYYEYDFGTRTISGEGFAVTANMTTYSNVVSLMFINQYNLLDDGSAIPFARMGLGLAHQDQNLEAGIYVVENPAWQFILNPELGLRINLSADLGAVISGAYTFLPESNDVLPTSFWNLKLGLFWLH